MYNSLFHATDNKKTDLFAKADEYVLNNFMKGYFSIKKRIEPAKFDKSVLPYKNPNWDGQLFPTKDTDRFFGMIHYTMDQSSCYSFTSVFSILNKKENTIEQFFPNKNPRLFSGEQLYVDTYNTVLYLPVWIKKEFDYSFSDCQYNKPLEKHVYSSKDEGKNWQEDKNITELFNKYDVRKIEFLDKDHTLAYSRKTLKQTVKNSEIVQGTYYLLKNMQVIDSLKTPDDLYYNSNINNYGFSVKNDTVLLGRWTYDENYTVGKTKYFQPFLKKINDKWKFQLTEETYSRSTRMLGKSKIPLKNIGISC